MVVKADLEKLGIQYASVNIGETDIIGKWELDLKTFTLDKL